MEDTRCLARAKRAQLAGFPLLKCHYSADRWNFEKSDTFLDIKRPPLSIETTFETLSRTHLESYDLL